MAFKSGRHFLQIPGPSTVPDRVLRAIDMPVIDHRGPGFAALGHAVLDGMREVFATSGAVVVFPSSGTGAWEAAIVNARCLPGDRVLMAETGTFRGTLVRDLAKQAADCWSRSCPGDWRHGVDIRRQVESRLAADAEHDHQAR